MPSALATPILPPALVAVTGANGFIAQHCVSALLSEGYNVIGTARTESKVKQILDTHGSHPNLSAVVVDDITSPESYTAALESTSPSAILHLASPFHYNTTNFEQDIMIPSVKGSTAILEAAKKMGAVRRVVLTSSFVAIYDAAKGPQPGKIYTANDWSPLTYEDGVNAAVAPTAYRASKAVGERVAWEWMKQNPDSGFDLVSLNPGMVFGAFLPRGMPNSLAQLNTSNEIVWGVVSVGEDGTIPPTRAPVWVSVKDVALAQTKAVQLPEAGGQRYLLAAGVYCNQEIADVSRQAAKKYLTRIPKGCPGQRESATHFCVDASDSQKALGIEWESLDHVLEELLPQLYELERRTLQV